MDTLKPNNDAQLLEEQAAYERAKKTKKILLTSSIVVVVAAVIVIIWYLVAVNGSRKADEAIALADTEQNDSIQLAYYMDAAKMGYKSGSRAGLQAAIALYQKGEYQQALDYLKDSSVSSSIVEAGRYALMGDCYVNLEDYNNAISSYNKAMKAAKGNTEIVPFILVKEANVYRQVGQYGDEYAAYKQIIDNYPNYVRSLQQRNGLDLRKYAERAKAAADNK